MTSQLITEPNSILKKSHRLGRARIAQLCEPRSKVLRSTENSDNARFMDLECPEVYGTLYGNWSLRHKKKK